MNQARSLTPRPVRLWNRLVQGLAWRWKFVLRPRLGIRDRQWLRVVSEQAMDDFVSALDYRNMDAVELSPGRDVWQRLGFQSYRAWQYDEGDVCERPLAQRAFDMVIAEHVLEHVLWPLRAVRNIHAMLRRGGWFVAVTPFLYRVHDYPVDCSRWTEVGMKHLLLEGGFSADKIYTGSWGNRACVKANFRKLPNWVPWWHPQHNEADFPVTVWAFAQKVS
jgi:SAM-dependent methyltransferase